jgi:predicted esterase YcpF (UPF0227 family)
MTKKPYFYKAFLILIFSVFFSHYSFAQESEKRNTLKEDSEKAFEIAKTDLSPISPITGRKLEALVDLIEFKTDLASTTTELLTLTIAICKERRITPYELQKLLDAHNSSTNLLFNTLSDHFVIPASLNQMFIVLNSMLHQNSIDQDYLKTLIAQKVVILPEYSLFQKLTSILIKQIEYLKIKGKNLEASISNCIFNEKRTLSGPVFKQALVVHKIQLEENKRLVQLFRKLEIQMKSALVQLEQINMLLKDDSNKLIRVEAGKFYAKTRIEMGISIRQINDHLKGLKKYINKIKKKNKDYHDRLVKKANSVDINRFNIARAIKERVKIKVELENDENSKSLRESVIAAFDSTASEKILNSLKFNLERTESLKELLSELLLSPISTAKAANIARKLELKKSNQPQKAKD